MPGQGQGLQFNIQGGPEYQQQIHKDILKQAKERLEKPYESYQRLGPEQRERQQKKIAELETLIKGPKEAFIPLYVTGSSQAIGVTPLELREIIKNKNFAERLISASTGIVRVPHEEIEDLQERANKIYDAHKDEIIKSSKQQEESEKREELLRKEELSKIEKENQIKLEKERNYLNKIEDFEKNFNFSRNKNITINDIMSKGSNLPIDSPLYNIVSNKNKEYLELISKIPHHDSGGMWRTYYDKIQPSITDTEVEKEKQRVKKEIETLSKPITQPLSPSITSQVNVEPVLKRAGAEREIVKLMAPQQNLAPLEKQHYQALGMLEKSFDDDALKLAQSELNKAKEHNILNKVEPWVRESVESPDVYTQKYMKNYQDNVIKSLQDEYRRSFLEDIFPKIEARYIGKGSYNSGARLQAINRASESADRSLRNEIGKLLSHAHDKGMEHHQTEKSRKLAAAQVIGGASQQDREAMGRGAEQFRTLGLTKQALTHANVGALSHFATAEQQQEQNRLNLARQEHERAQNHEMENLKQMHNMALGLPAGPTQQIVGSPNIMNPTPPNAYGLGASALGALAMLGSPQQQQRGYSKGGLVRKRYADGGDVNSSNLENEMRNLMMQKEMDYRRQLQEIRQPNTLNSLTSNITHSMLSNMRGNPLENLGKGISNTLEGISSSKQREANLMDKINDSRMQQYKILADFENRRSQREHQQNTLSSNQRYREQQLAQREKHHNQKLALQSERINNPSEKGMQNKKVSPTEIRLVNDAKKDLLRARRMKKEVAHLGNLITKTSTGPIVGNIKGIIPETKIDNQIRVGTNKIILDMHQGMKNIPRSEEFMKRIESTKPNVKNHPEANTDALNLMLEGANDIEEQSISTLLSAGMTPSEIEKQFGVKIPSNFYESGENSPSHESEYEDEENNPSDESFNWEELGATPIL
jgi:hypothetical protein